MLVLAAHPDDEVLGCGGTIVKLSEQGFDVHVAFLADGVSARPGAPAEFQQELQARRAAARAAGDILGAKSLSFGDFPDNRMDTVAMLDIARTVEQLLAQYQPRIVFTHHAGDVNVDHRRVHEATVVACRPRGVAGVQRVLCFEVASSTECQPPASAPLFAPNWFVDITATLERKLTALDAYAAEMRP